MQIFKTYSFTWVEIGIFKIAMLAIGIAIGAFWHELIREYIIPIVIVAIVTSAYIGYIGFQQAIRDTSST